MITYYVKKIWSLNPKLYKFLSYKEAEKRYEDYLTSWQKAMVERQAGVLKTFEQWLKTEI